MAPKKFYPALLLTFLLAGTLDAISAMITNPHVPADKIFRFIASGVFGKAAFTGDETTMVGCGILFHYLIAYIFTALEFIIFPWLYNYFKNKYLIALLYGVITWLIMTFIVVPLSNTPKFKAPATLYGILTGILALVICIGLPVAIMAYKYYRPVNKKSMATAY